MMFRSKRAEDIKKRRLKEDKGFIVRKRVCRFCVEKVKAIDYKDIQRISKSVTERGKIMSKRISGTCAKHQRQLAEAVKLARFVALLPYTVK